MDTPGESLPMRRVAPLVFFAFLLTFLAPRVLVIQMMTRRTSKLFFHARGTHVQHLNCGIFILSLVGARMRPSDKLRKLCALLYGFGMALTLDDRILSRVLSASL